MRENPRWVSALVVIAALALAYVPFVTNQGVLITDDSFTSDVTNGEWPVRVEIGRLVREGSWPVWTRDIYGGSSLVPTGPGAEPLTVLLFSLLSPVAALNAYVMFVMILAGVGAAFLSRALGSSAAGAAVAGLGFAFSGYMVSQLKHLGIVSCIAWAPFALLALYRAFETTDRAHTVKWLGLFSLLFGMQWLAGFAQSAYISALLYVAWGFSLIIRNRAGRSWLFHTLAFGVAGIVGALIGAIQLISAFELAKLSDRSQGVSIAWATQFNYWLPDLWSFIWPYKNGDIGDHSYVGQGIFWEDYSYTGLITLLLALSALVWFRTRFVRFWWLSAVLALLLVLGKHTFVFSAAFHVLPGLSFFRFPTRFLFVVHLALSVLAALGLTQLEAWLSKRAPQTARLGGVIAWLVVGLSFVDLQFFQLRQNPIADADRWMTPPATVTFLKERLGDFRAYSFLSKATHARAAQAARGWADLEPFYEVRDFIEPNSNLLWNIDMPDGYMGLLTRETGALWGSSQVLSRVEGLAAGARTKPALLAELSQVLRALSVKYVISPAPFTGFGLGQPVQLGVTWLFELPSPAPRFHVALRTQRVESDDEAFLAMRRPGFDPEHDVTFVESGSAAEPSLPATGAPAQVTVTAEAPLSSSLEVEAPAEAVIVNTEAFHPHWVAEVDGQRAEVKRVNINQRALRVPAGRHTVRFFFDAPSYRVGFAITLASLLVALVVTGVAWRRAATRAI